MKTKVFRVLKKDGIPFVMVVVSSIIYSLGFLWFLQPVGIYTGGIPGVAQLLVELFLLMNIKLNVGLLIFVLNIPIIIIGIRFVSKRFAFYSIISVLLQSLLTSGIIPFVDFVVNVGEGMNLLVCSIIGAILTGFSCGLALRFGTSTGGLDIIAQAATLKNSKVSVGVLTLISNVLIGCIGGGIIQKRLDIVLYTFIRIIINSLVLDKIHTAYSYVVLNIISTKGEELTDIVLRQIHRGCTIIPAEGAYTKRTRYDILMVVSSYEIHTTVDLIKKIDPNVFIIVSPAKRIFGNYVKKPII